MYSINRRFDGKTMKRIGGRSPNPSSITKNKAIKMADAWRSVGLNARVIPNVKGFNVYVGNPRKYYARKGFEDNRGREPKVIPAKKFIGISGLREDQRFYNSKKKEFPTEKEVEDEVQELQWSFDDEIYDEMSWNASFGEGSDEALALFNAGDDDDVVNLYEDLNDEMWEKRAELLYEAGFTQDSKGDIRALAHNFNPYDDTAMPRMIGDPKSFESALNIFENNIPTRNTGKWKNTNRYGAGLGTNIGMKDLRRMIGKWIDTSINMAQDTPKRKDAFDREIGRIPEYTIYTNEITYHNPRYDRWIVGFLTEYNTFYNNYKEVKKIDAEKFLEALIVAKNDPYAKDLPSIDIDALAIKTLKELDMSELDYSRIVAYRDEQDPASRMNPMFWRSISSRRANL